MGCDQPTYKIPNEDIIHNIERRLKLQKHYISDIKEVFLFIFFFFFFFLKFLQFLIF